MATKVFKTLAETDTKEKPFGGILRLYLYTIPKTYVSFICKRIHIIVNSVINVVYAKTVKSYSLLKYGLILNEFIF